VIAAAAGSALEHPQAAELRKRPVDIAGQCVRPANWNGTAGVAMTNSDETLRYIAAQLTYLKRVYQRNSQWWPPALEAIRLLANGGQSRPEFDGDVWAYDYEAVGKRLSLSVRSVRRLVASGLLPTVSIGGSTRITRDDLEAFVSSLDRRRFVDVKEQEEVRSA
jgi:excisionase family DNA binding protein